MESRFYQIILYKEGPGDLITLDELARQTGVHRDLLLRMVDLGILDPQTRASGLLFCSEAVRTVCRAVRLRNQLGINWAGVGLVLDLLDRIEQLEDEIRLIKERYNI